MRKIILSIFLVLSAMFGLCQSEGFQFSLACKTINNIDSVKFHYVIHNNGSELIQTLRQEDIKNCKDLFVTPFSRLVKKDETLKNLPEIPEGKYAFWNKETDSWEILDGGLEEITNSIENEELDVDCKYAHSGKFKYVDYPDPSAYILRKGNKHIEYYGNGTYSTIFKIKWISDCAYVLIFMETNDPQISFMKKGDSLTVEISNVSEKGYNYKANLYGNISLGAHIKIE